MRQKLKFWCAVGSGIALIMDNYGTEGLAAALRLFIHDHIPFDADGGKAARAAYSIMLDLRRVTPSWEDPSTEEAKAQASNESLFLRGDDGRWKRVRWSDPEGMTTFSAWWEGKSTVVLGREGYVIYEREEAENLLVMMSTSSSTARTLDEPYALKAVLMGGN